jgi:hypothetical protein
VSSGRRLSNLLGALTLGVLLSACGGTAPVSGQASPQAASGSQLLQHALTDARESGSVREVVTARRKDDTIVMTNDVGAAEGRQLISLTPTETARVMVLGNTAYVAGNQTALTHYFGFPAATSRQVGDRWVSIPSSNPDYVAVADDATLASAVKDLGLSGHLTELVPSTVDGQSVIGIIGAATHVNGTPLGTVYVSRSAHPLPVEATYNLSNGARSTLRFARWGERVALRRPRQVVGATVVTKLVKSAVLAEAKSPLNGEWDATGTVLKSHDSASDPAGLVLERLWLIQPNCADARCTLEFSRQIAETTAGTPSTPLTAPLRPTHSGWLTMFTELNAACRGTSGLVPGTEISHWTMTYTPTTITAIEQTRTAGSDCETGTTTIRWAAVRAPSKSITS